MSFNRVIASTELRLGDIAHDGDNGFLPIFGPSLLHMYGATNTSGVTTGNGPYFKGALLVSLKTIVPYYQQNLRTVTVEPVAPIIPDNLWVQEEFCLYCPIFEMSMLDNQAIQKFTGLAMTVGEIPSGRPVDEEFLALASDMKYHKTHYTGCLEVIKMKRYGFIEFRRDYPVLQLATRLPDFRFRIYRNNIVQGIISDLEFSICDVEKRLQNFEYTAPIELFDKLSKAVDDATENIRKYLDIVCCYNDPNGSQECLQQYSTALDRRQLAVQTEEIEKIYNQLTQKTLQGSVASLCQMPSRYGTKESLMGTRRAVKMLLAEIKVLAEHLRSTLHKSPHGWPDLIIWLLNEGSRVAYAKLRLADILYSVIPEQRGSECGRIQTIYMKPLKCERHSNTPETCYCITGKVEVLLWMGLFSQRRDFCNFMPPNYHLKNMDLDMHIKASTMVIACRAYIYRAKLNSEGSETLNNPYNAFVRVNALSHVKDTQVVVRTSTPVWNQVLTIKKLICASVKRMLLCPPFVLVEVYDEHPSGRIDLVGRFQIQPVYDEDPKYVPKLQWYEIYKGAQNMGQLLMSVQFIQVPEQLVRSTSYGSCASTLYVQMPNVFENEDIENDEELIERLPLSLIPHSVTYKVDVYWWGLRDINVARKPLVVLEIDDLVLKSDIILERKPNSNFPNGRMSQIIEIPMNEDFRPSLCLRLYDSSTFGRTLFLGTNVIKNPSKFMIDWLSKTREASLNTVSVQSSDFCEVDGQMLYVKKSNKYLEDYEELSMPLLNSYRTTKKSIWPTLFKKKDPPEEELSLLPVHAKVTALSSIMKRHLRQETCDNWWIRYFQSEKVKDFEEEIEKQASDDISDITIYEYELEQQPEFSKFKDWCSSLKFYNGKKTGIPEKDEQLQRGILKTGIAIYRWPPAHNTVAVSLNGVELDKGYFADHPNNDSTKHLVRVYVVKALNLPKDCAGKLDPFVAIQCGKRHLGDRNCHVPDSIEPIFGKMYEFSCTLPDDYLLTVSLHDFDPMPPDDLIGSTTIDLEDRVYTKHRARVGLASEYSLSGPSKWRDRVKPSGILEELCATSHIPPPIFPDAYSVIVNGVEYRDNGTVCRCMTPIERKENICLSILHKWQTLPICGYQLVPEHVETRSLYHPDKPGLERGKIQLWVDIFPLDTDTYVPPPRDISSRKVEEYELRVVVWDVQSLLVGQGDWKTANLYVQIYLGSDENAQQTDIHYNSISGEGNFNWRMVFSFQYNHAERKMINTERGPFTEYRQFVQPILYVNLLENNEDELLGSLTLNLNSMSQGGRHAHECKPETERTVNLFTLGRIRAWWPFKAIDFDTGDEVPGGVVDLEMTLLPRERAVLMPVGVGRNAPSPLPDPARPQPPRPAAAGRSHYKCQGLMQHKWQEVIFFIVIVAVVWFLVYVTLFIYSSKETFYFKLPITQRLYGRPKNIEGIMKSISHLKTDKQN
ncbi:c2 domain-containing protein [Phthorimaea operculella]|nr:c2 domain-containing protein [Phthorimaea operculella]